MPEAAKLRNSEEQGGPGIPLRVPGPVQKLGEYPRRVRQFLHEVREEMRRVTWPTWAAVQATTGVVVITVLVFALYFWVVDTGVSVVVDQLIQRFRP